MKLGRSLRWQLTLVFSAASAAILLTAAVGMDGLIEHALWASVDASVEEEAETLMTLDDSRKSADLADAVAGVGREHAPGPGKFVRVTRTDGEVLASFGIVPEGIPAGQRSRPGIRLFTVWNEGIPYRVASYTSPTARSYEVGVQVEREMTLLRQARIVIAASLISVLLVLASLAWAIAGRATAELGRLASELETIEAGSLDRRLVPRLTSEVDRLAQVLNRLLARLESAMTSLRRFTADAAHELRTPISGLRAHLELALADLPVGARRDGLADALEQAERLRRLAEDLLTLSAVEAGEAEKELVSLDAIALEVADFLEPVAQEQGRPFVCRADSSVRVRGVAVLLKRVLLNLLDNAFRHTPAGTAVGLSVCRQEGRAAIEVTDEGPGITEEELPLVFERFHRGRGASAGTGLGLALCREIVSRHGGDISVRSVPGSGTTIIATLPLARELSASP